jgi:predicted amidophosphoribosyltransferase
MMAEKLAQYFCPNRACPGLQRVYRYKGACPHCGTRMERLKYCPDCGRPGTPYQNKICYFCQQYLLDFFASDNYLPNPEDKNDYP